MNHDYADIIDRIDEPPTFWDEHAVPRYCEFEPEAVANIYADGACLVLIACQDCGHEFRVAFSEDMMSRYHLVEHRWDKGAPDGALGALMEEVTLAKAVQRGSLHYGDPPNACPAGCAAGATMNSIPVRVLEFWSRDKVEGQKSRSWVRHPELEVPIRPDWWDNADDPVEEEQSLIARGIEESWLADAETLPE